jgi:nitrogen fixation protein NifB
MENPDIKNHPCFNKEAKKNNARIHLPVAPKCNIQCNYCNRKYDCVNESRPGVTSSLLLPVQAVDYLDEMSKHIDNISVIGIAGPGDPMADPSVTLETIKLTREKFPGILYCLSTNGVNLLSNIDELVKLGVSHITITINAVDPVIASKIYSWVRHEKNIYRGLAAGEFIVGRQLEALAELVKHNIQVKVNCIVIPGINDKHIVEVAETVASLGADIFNCVPLIPTDETEFQDIEEPGTEMMNRIRSEASGYIKIMSHCSRCRADAAGLLGNDFKGAHSILQEFALRALDMKHNRPRIAVASNEGILVNLHLGEAESLYIYEQKEDTFIFVEERKTPEPGCGDVRWKQLGESLKDCRALLVSGIGESPTRVLQSSGIRVIQMTGLIEEGLDAVYNSKQIRTVKKADAFKCGESCRGTATGCA